MKPNKKAHSPVIKMIENWLSEMPYPANSLEIDITRNAIEKAYSALGYGYPFDWEQRAINQLLLDAKADEFRCLVAWGYYHDYKMMLSKSA
jgi:hypothetical protein